MKGEGGRMTEGAERCLGGAVPGNLCRAPRSALRSRRLRSFGSTEERPKAAAPRWHEVCGIQPEIAEAKQERRRPKRQSPKRQRGSNPQPPGAFRCVNAKVAKTTKERRFTTEAQSPQRRSACATGGSSARAEGATGSALADKPPVAHSATHLRSPPDHAR